MEYYLIKRANKDQKTLIISQIIKNLEKRLAGKLDEIKKDLQDLGDVYATVDADRRASFDRDMTPDEIKTFSIKNRLGMKAERGNKGVSRLAGIGFFSCSPFRLMSL